MIVVPESSELSDFNLNDFVLPKITDERGYIYVVHDRMFPDYVKIGRTNDPAKSCAMIDAINDVGGNIHRAFVLTKPVTDKQKHIWRYALAAVW